MRARGPMLASLTACAVALGGCGGGIVLQDDLAVVRTGGPPPGRLTLSINDSGTVACNGHRPAPISDPQLIQARYIATSVATQAKRGVSLPPEPGSVYRYAVRTPDGHFSFSDDSPRKPQAFDALMLLVQQLSQARACAL